MSSVIIASVDMDCDGPSTYFYLVSIPADLLAAFPANSVGKEVAKYARKTGQLVQSDVIFDASEWQTYEVGVDGRYIPRFRSLGGEVKYDSARGNCFER